MGKIKFGRALGLSILGALSMMAMFVMSAQAAEFEVNGSTANLLATVTGAQEGVVSFSVPAKNAVINCTTTTVGAGTEIIDKTKGLAVVTFSGCTVLSQTKGTELPCTVHGFTMTATLWPVTHGAKRYVTAESDGSDTLTTILLLGELCVLPEVGLMKGKVSAEITTNNSVTNLLTFNSTVSTLLGDALTLFLSPATITGKVTLKLTGAHTGLAWGVV